MKELHVKRILMVLPLTIMLLTQIVVANTTAEVNALYSSAAEISDVQENVATKLSSIAIEKEAEAKKLQKTKTETIEPVQLETLMAPEPQVPTSDAAQRTVFYNKLKSLEALAKNGEVAAMFNSGATNLTRTIGTLLNTQQNGASIQAACVDNFMCNVARSTTYTENFTMTSTGTMLSGETTYAVTYQLAEINATAAAALGNVPVTFYMVQYAGGGININYMDIGDTRI